MVRGTASLIACDSIGVVLIVSVDICVAAPLAQHVSSVGICKLISNHCADYGLQDYGLQWVQFHWHKEDYGLRGGGGDGRSGDWC